LWGTHADFVKFPVSTMPSRALAVPPNGWTHTSAAAPGSFDAGGPTCVFEEPVTELTAGWPCTMRV
jgi:hypothetical protein